MRWFEIYSIFLLAMSCSISVNCKEKPECMQVENFVSHYRRLLSIIPQNIVPQSRYCSHENFTLFHNKAVGEYNEAIINETCHFHLHKLNVIGMLFNQMQDIWNTANCQDCVDNQNDTIMFFELSEELNSCIQSHHESPCLACAYNYTAVQDKYESMNKQRRGKLCFDIDDQMNQTRHAWSATFNCCKDKQRSQKLFITFASIFSSLPLVFYAAMYFMARRKEKWEELTRVPLLDDNDLRHSASLPEVNENHSITTVVDQEPSSSSSFQNRNVLQNDKLNNLDRAHVREGKLINLHDEPVPVNSNNYIDKNLNKSTEVDDDVSILAGEATITNGIKDLLQ